MSRHVRNEWLQSVIINDKASFTLYCQHHGCWWSGVQEVFTDVQEHVIRFIVDLGAI